MSDDQEPTTRSFRPGEWFGIFGEHATVLLPPTEKARVAALWELVDEGAGFDETLDALIATGLRDLPGFVLVSEGEGVTRVVLRGAARASFTAGGETVDLDGSEAGTWVERSLHEVTRTSIEVAEESGTADLRITAGLVRLSRVDQPPRTPGVETGAAEPLSAGPVVPSPWSRSPSSRSSPLPSPSPSSTARPPRRCPTSPESRSSRRRPTARSPRRTSTRTRNRRSGCLSRPSPRRPRRPPRPAPPAPPVSPPPAVPGDEDHDGMTQSGSWDPGQFARQQPGIPGQPPAPSVTARPVARLLFSNGETVEVDRAVLVGRAPEARRFTSTEQPRLVTVPSPNQEISSTHLEIRPGSGADHGTAVVTDMGSTNGTVLVQPGLPPEDLQPGIAVQLIPGAIIDLGDGVTIQVANP